MNKHRKRYEFDHVTAYSQLLASYVAPALFLKSVELNYSIAKITIFHFQIKYISLKLLLVNISRNVFGDFMILYSIFLMGYCA